MNKTVRMISILLTLVFVYSWLDADEGILLKLRLYKGIRISGRISQEKMNSYTLRKIADACVLSDQEAGREKKSIIKIYNLKYAHSLYKIGMLLRKGAKVETRQGLILNKRKMNIRIGHLVEKSDLFKVEILPLGKDKNPLLSSEILIPAGKIAVLGFEDSMGEVFFLAINRLKEQTEKGSESAQTIEFPELTSRSVPPYPSEALAKDISGVVILECHTDVQGKVNNIHVIEGPKALAEPAKVDIFKWRYSPWKINGRAEPIRMHLLIFFQIKSKSGTSIDTSEKEISDTYERYKPIMKKWRTTYPVSDENRAIVEIIIVKGQKA